MKTIIKVPLFAKDETARELRLRVRRMARGWRGGRGFLRFAKTIISFHHENGTVHPHGLSGRSIPLWGRIADGEFLNSFITELNSKKNRPVALLLFI
jgi:response regulator RpfG family c-di-GMP phosphodiesterase